MALPVDFITRTHALLGEEYGRLEAALEEEPPVSIRLNTRKTTSISRTAEPVAWCETGYYLPERLPFTFDPLFHAGAYYVQEASSMFLERAIKTYVHVPVRCLDLCAAPGGKSTHLTNLLPEGSLLVSNEVIRSRSYVLAENISKWGQPDTIVLNNDPEEIGRALPRVFDVIITDVPCSGEGMFRKDTDSADEWSVDHVHLCASRQRRILHDIWNALKPGGLLVYSTCTYNTEEDEETIHYIIEELGAEALPIPTQETWRITGSLRFDHPVYRFFPHKTRGEGFFLAVLRKAEGTIEEIRIKPKRKKEPPKTIPAIPSEVKRFLLDETGFSFEWNGASLRGIHGFLSDTLSLMIDRKLRILSYGICLGEAKRKDFIPSQELAMSVFLRQEAFSSVELDWTDAIRYLKKESLVLPSDTPKGYVLVRYQGFPLGFVKQLSNRANNLYPQEWRIRSGYLPDKPKTILDL